MKKVRIGFIGVGQIAKQHLKRYQDIVDAEVVAASDVNEAELNAVGDKHGIAHRYTDFRELLKRDDLDAVDVCLHNNLHAPATIAALEAGKHVYCEKPIAGSYADGVAMVEAAKRTGKMLHIQFFTLFDKETKAAKRLIDDGALGKVYHARSTGFRRRGRPFVDGYGTDRFVKKASAGGGALFDMGVYHIARMVHLLGQPEIERVVGRTYQETDMDEGRRKSSGYDVEELGLGFVTFKGGVTLDLIEAWAIHLDGFEGSSVVGSKGGVRFDPLRFFTNVGDMSMDGTFNLDAYEGRRRTLEPSYAAYDSAQHHWVAALKGTVPLLPSAQIALKTMLIQEGIYLSHKENRELTAGEIVKASVSTAVKL